MRIELFRGCLCVASLLATAACTDSKQTGLASTGPAFGEALRQTFAAQVIDPAPHYDTELLTSGQNAATAQDRYNTDQVKKPDRISTSRSQSAGGGN